MIGLWKGKVGLEVLEQGREEGERQTRRKKRQRKGRWEEDGVEPRGLEKQQVVRDLTAGKRSSVVVDLPHLGEQLINIISEWCGVFFAPAYWGWRFTATPCHLICSGHPLETYDFCP